jgi:hypothetical protein
MLSLIVEPYGQVVQARECIWMTRSEVLRPPPQHLPVDRHRPVVLAYTIESKGQVAQARQCTRK